MVSTSQKISCLLARISSILHFQLCSIWRKKCFHQQQQTAIEKMEENVFYQPENPFPLLKIYGLQLPLMSMTVSITRKNSEQKKTDSSSQKICFHLPERRILLKKKHFHQTEKELLLPTVSEKWNAIWLPLARKSVSPSHNNLSLVETFLERVAQ